MGRFKEKHGLLRSVEAGEDVRNVGRVELAFKNGDLLSIGMNCEDEADEGLFGSIVSAIKGTAGVVLSQESRCQAQRRNGISTVHNESVDSSPNSADTVHAADAERHMQELLAMEDAQPKSLGETAAQPSRRSQRKGKNKSRQIARAQSHKSASNENHSLSANEEGPEEATNKEDQPGTATVEAKVPPVAEIPGHCIGESNVENLVDRQLFVAEEKEMQNSTETVCRKGIKGPGPSAEQHRDGGSTVHRESVDASPSSAGAANIADAERHLQELLAMEKETGTAVVETAAPRTRRSQRRGKHNNRPITPAQSCRNDDSPSMASDGTAQDVAAGAGPQETTTVDATQSRAPEISELCLVELDNEVQTSSETGCEEAGEALGSSALLELESEGEEAGITTNARAVLALEAMPKWTTEFSMVRRRRAKRSGTQTANACLCGYKGCSCSRSARDMDNDWQASITFTEQEKSEESLGKPSTEAPVICAKSEPRPERYQQERVCMLLRKLGPPPSNPPPPPPPPPPPRPKKITAVAEGNAATASLVPRVQMVAASCIIGEEIPTPWPSFAPSLFWPDLDEPMATSVPVEDKMISSAVPHTPLPCRNFESIVDAWSSMQSSWHPMQSKLGLWTANNDILSS